MTTNLVLPKNFVELGSEEMNYVDGGRFFGAYVSSANTTAMWNAVASNFRNKDLSNKTTAQLGKLVMMTPTALAIKSMTVGKAAAVMALIPIGGKIAIAAMLAGSVAIAGSMMNAGRQGRSFRMGLEVGRGWLGLPTFDFRFGAV